MYLDSLKRLAKKASATGVKIIVEGCQHQQLRQAHELVTLINQVNSPYIVAGMDKQVEYALSEYQNYYHHERIHQSLGRIIEPKHKTDNNSEIKCIERLGGLLKSYHRLAA